MALQLEYWVLGPIALGLSPWKPSSDFRQEKTVARHLSAPFDVDSCGIGPSGSPRASFAGSKAWWLGRVDQGQKSVGENYVDDHAVLEIPRRWPNHRVIVVKLGVGPLASWRVGARVRYTNGETDLGKPTDPIMLYVDVDFHFNLLSLGDMYGSKAIRMQKLPTPC